MEGLQVPKWWNHNLSEVRDWLDSHDQQTTLVDVLAVSVAMSVAFLTIVSGVFLAIWWIQ